VKVTTCAPRSFRPPALLLPLAPSGVPPALTKPRVPSPSSGLPVLSFRPDVEEVREENDR